MIALALTGLNDSHGMLQQFQEKFGSMIVWIFIGMTLLWLLGEFGAVSFIKLKPLLPYIGIAAVLGWALLGVFN